MPKTSQHQSYLNVAYLDKLYADYLHDPSSVSPEWQRYFTTSGGQGQATGALSVSTSFQPRSIFNPPAPRTPLFADKDTPQAHAAAGLQERVDSLVRSYRTRGHTAAQIDPLRQPKPQPPELDPAYHGLTSEHLDHRFACPCSFGSDQLATLRQIIDCLHNTYCRSIGVQFMHIDDHEVRQWLQERMESTQNRLTLSRDEQLRILTRLTDAVVFEEFLRKKFIGAKSFSLEGSESLIPLLDVAIERVSEQGVSDIVLGMAHRGRLNVLANIIGKSPREIFREFRDTDPRLHMSGGDVKYHQGHSNDWITESGQKVHLSLCFNPSHLEFVNPVAIGRTRARQDRRGDAQRKQTMLILIHGDAAFVGEGVVQETLNLSRLAGYEIGGTIHIVVNNQIGFTTPPEQGRSTMYATSVAKMLPSPIFHVNGEDPEAVAQCVELALGFRARFKQDVVIDMYGYRRLGHNESDEPAFTQPLLYQRIAQRKTVREGYLDHLLKLGGVTAEEADEIASNRQALLEENLAQADDESVKSDSPAKSETWKKYTGGLEYEDQDAQQAQEIETGASRDKLVELLESQTRLPVDFQPHPKIQRFLESRQKMAAGTYALDWSAAESLAFATLAHQGIGTRLSGQDSGRGTFSHRHAILYDIKTGQTYTPLEHLSPGQARIEIVNSPLSETGVLGFEYGYSLDSPDHLVLWEAQFGDFANAAQVIVDQFIASAEKKWRRLSGLVLLLPHGHEGMGPEHSSARIERFLQLAADDNMQIVNPTTPAQYFHCLRRQALNAWRKPLVIFTPKSLLRHPQSVSSMDELAAGSFQRIIPDASTAKKSAIKRILLCSGKIYYELVHERKKHNRNDVAVIRIEQLYPLYDQMLVRTLKDYPDGTPIYWVQEEPQNMGAWSYLRVRFGQELLGRWPFESVCRPASASPESGSHTAHKLEQARLVNQAFGEQS